MENDEDVLAAILVHDIANGSVIADNLALQRQKNWQTRNIGASG